MITANDLIKLKKEIVELNKKYYIYNAIETGDSITSY